MTNHTDFDEIGKKTPYRIPEGFFDEMQHEVLLQADRPQQRRPLIKYISYSLAGIAAAVAAFVFIPRTDTETENDNTAISWIEQVSDEDLNAMADMSEYDIFMN